MKKYTIFNHEFELFWGKRKPIFSSHQLYTQKIWHEFLFIAFILFIALNSTYDRSKDGIDLPVTTHSARFYNGKDATQFYSDKLFGLQNNNAYEPEKGGKLIWHPQGFKQAIILGIVDSDGLDIFHVALLILYVAVFYFMIGRSPSVTFSKKVVTGFVIIIILIGLSGFFESYKDKLLSQYIYDITNGQFYLRESGFPTTYFICLGGTLLFLLRFPRKAVELQEQQALTI